MVSCPWWLCSFLPMCEDFGNRLCIPAQQVCTEEEIIWRYLFPLEPSLLNAKLAFLLYCPETIAVDCNKY